MVWFISSQQPILHFKEAAFFSATRSFFWARDILEWFHLFFLTSFLGFSQRLDSLVQQHELSYTSPSCLELHCSLCTKRIVSCKHLSLLPLVTHLICSILTQDVLLMYFCIEFLAFPIITKESFGTMRVEKPPSTTPLRASQTSFSVGVLASPASK